MSPEERHKHALHLRRVAQRLIDSATVLIEQAALIDPPPAKPPGPKPLSPAGLLVANYIAGHPGSTWEKVAYAVNLHPDYVRRLSRRLRRHGFHRPPGGVGWHAPPQWQVTQVTKNRSQTTPPAPARMIQDETSPVASEANRS